MNDTELIQALRQYSTAAAEVVGPASPPTQTPLQDSNSVRQGAAPRAWRVKGDEERRLRRWPVAALALTAVIGAGTAASAAGLLPGSVMSVFQEAVDWGHAPGVEPHAAHIVAVATAGETKAEYWVSSSSTGAVCSYIRLVQEGLPDNGPKGCVEGPLEVFGGEMYVDIGSTGSPDEVYLAGKITAAAASARVTLTSGLQLTFAVQLEGHFLGITNDPEVLASMNIRSLDALNEHGTLIERREYKRRPG